MKAIARFLILVSCAVAVFHPLPLFAPPKPYRPPPPPYRPPPHIPVEPYRPPSETYRPKPEPIKPENPDFAVPKSPEALRAEAILRKAEADQTYKFQKVRLTSTTGIAVTSEGHHSASASFSVRNQKVTIQCVSPFRAVVARFLEFINELFRKGSVGEISMSLETIVKQARQDIRARQNLNSTGLTLQYIDQFGETHVVQISPAESGLMLVTR